MRAARPTGAADDVSLVGEIVIAHFHSIPAGAKRLRHQSGLGELTGLYASRGSLSRSVCHGGFPSDDARWCRAAVGAVDRQASDGRKAIFGCHVGCQWEAGHGRLNRLRWWSQRVSGSVPRLAQPWQYFQQVGISMQRLGDILDARSELPLSRQALPAIDSASGQVFLEALQCFSKDETSSQFNALCDPPSGDG
jgi:hypothetical protein